MLKSIIYFFLFLFVSALMASQITVTNINAPLTALSDESGTIASYGTGSLILGYFTNDTAVQQGDLTNFVTFSETQLAVNGYGPNPLDGILDTYFLFSDSPAIDPNVYLYITLSSTDTTSQKAEALVIKSDAKFSDNATIHLGTSGTVLWGHRPGNGEDPYGDGETISTKAIIPEPSTYALTLGLLVFLTVSWLRKTH